MALPGTGVLSLGDIATEQAISLSNVSLRSMSSTAGFSTPDSVSEFYGYANVTFVGNFAAADPCNNEYWDIYYFVAFAEYYRYIGPGNYEILYNYAQYWYEFLYYEPRLDGNIYKEWIINSGSSIFTDNGNVYSAC